MTPVVAIGPSNYAGQATAWARAAAQHLGVTAWSFSGVPLRGGGFQFDIDKMFSRIGFRLPLAWRARARRFFDGVSHVALDGFKTFARWDRHAEFPADARRLAEMGYSMALIAHGSDVRDPLAHLARDEWSYFSVGDEKWRSTMIRQTERNRAFAAECGWPVFHSTPDMGFDLPGGTWLPVVVDIDAWSSTTPLLERERPVVVHIPSQRTPPIKGTQFIDPVLRDLHDEGVIEYVAPSGVPHQELRRIVRECDVVVDQLLFGSYGVAAVEAMAAGRVTVGRMNDAVRSRMTAAPEFLEANPETLRDVMLSIRDRRDELRAQAARNLAFVRTWHDGRVSAERLASWLR
ncbi:MAG: hypothetical protein Q4D89_10955 [Arachnia propionica]|uniref:hypothetical protein n=1 Tax=Arachnia propionica TaxID=1750 RepID=UPI0027094390|nr:hypothetical protein [Arachnia propionica]